MYFPKQIHWSALKSLIVLKWLCNPTETIFLVMLASLKGKCTGEALSQCSLPGAFLPLLYQETCLLSWLLVCFVFNHGLPNVLNTTVDHGEWWLQESSSSERCENKKFWYTRKIKSWSCKASGTGERVEEKWDEMPKGQKELILLLNIAIGSVFRKNKWNPIAQLYDKNARNSCRYSCSLQAVSDCVSVEVFCRAVHFLCTIYTC